MKTFFTIILTLLIGFGLGLFAYKYFGDKQVSIENLPQVTTGTCQYNGKTYKKGESFKSMDGCNSCGCDNGEVFCTMMACE